MALYRIKKHFFPTESFVIDFDFDNKKLHVLDDAEFAACKEHEMMATIDASDDETRGEMLKSIIEAYYASESADEAKLFGDELVHMCVELKSLFEITVLLMQMMYAGNILRDSNGCDCSELVKSWQVNRHPFVHMISTSKWYQQLSQYIASVSEYARQYNKKLTPEENADYEMYRDFMSNVISHPEYRLTIDEAIRCIKCFANPNHWVIEYIKENPPTINGIPMKEVA